MGIYVTPQLEDHCTPFQHSLKKNNEYFSKRLIAWKNLAYLPKHNPLCAQLLTHGNQLITLNHRLNFSAFKSTAGISSMIEINALFHEDKTPKWMENRRVSRKELWCIFRIFEGCRYSLHASSSFFACFISIISSKLSTTKWNAWFGEKSLCNVTKTPVFSVKFRDVVKYMLHQTTGFLSSRFHQ